MLTRWKGDLNRVSPPKKPGFWEKPGFYLCANHS